MPLIEDDAEYARLVGSKNMLDAMGRNPKTRAQLLRLMKEVAPNLPIPEIDAAAPVLNEVEKLNKRIDAMEQGRTVKSAEESAARTIAEGRKKLKDAGYTQEGIAAIEKVMVDRGLIDYEAGAALWEKESPPEEPAVPTGDFGRLSGLLDPPEENPWREIFKQPSKASAEKMLQRVANREVNQWFADNKPEVFRRRGR